MFPVTKIAEKDFILIFDKHECQVYRESGVNVKGMCNFRVGKVTELCKLRSVEPMPNQGSENWCNMASNSHNVAVAALSQEIWHQRLGHLSLKSMLLLKDLAHQIAFEE